VRYEKSEEKFVKFGESGKFGKLVIWLFCYSVILLFGYLDYPV